MRTPPFHAPRATDPFAAFIRQSVETDTRFSLTPGSIHRNDRPLKNEEAS